MPYKTIKDLPNRVRENLPDHAQEIFKSAYNSAWEQYKDEEDRRGEANREETAYKVAWSAVKDVYEKDSETGEWAKK